MKNTIRSFVALVIMMMSTFTFAGQGNGLITFLTVYENDVVVFGLQESSNQACDSRFWKQWAISLKTETGKAQYALLLTAQLENKAVRVSGKSDCVSLYAREVPYRVQFD